MDNETLRQLLKDTLKQRGVSPVAFCPNYKNRDGSPSWQDEADEVLCDPIIQELLVTCANSVGKSYWIALTICRILYGTHKFNSMFPDAVWIHCICKDSDTLRDTIQNYITKISNYEISAINEEGYKGKFRVSVHAGKFREITNSETKVRVTFGSAEKGAKGNVGVRPHLLICDEPIPKDLYEELVVRTTTKNSKFVTCATVVNAEHAWLVLEAQEILKTNPHNKRVISAKMTDSPFVEPNKIEYIKNTYGEESIQYKVRVLGALDVMSGVVYEGIEQCLVDNDFVPELFQHLTIEEQERNYIWAEAYDFGIGHKDPTLVGFFKIWSDGTIVQEDEVCMYENTLDEWVKAIHEKRNELDLPYYTRGYPRPNIVFDSYPEEALNRETGCREIVNRGTGLAVRMPVICVGDKQYLAKKMGVNSSSRIKTSFAERNIFIQPAEGSKVEEILPLCQNLVKNRNLRVKERCKYSINFAKTYVTKFNEQTGKITYDTPQNHWSDILRYLVEKLGNSNRFVKTIKDNLEFAKKSSLGNIIQTNVNRYRSV